MNFLFVEYVSLSPMDTKWGEISLAIQRGDYDLAHKIISSGITCQVLENLCKEAPIDFLITLNPCRIIYYAISDDRSDYIEHIVKTCPEILSRPNKHFQYPIHVFAHKINKKKINMLRTCIMAGININQQNIPYQQTLLQEIINNMYQHTIDLGEDTLNLIITLLDANANINIADNHLVTPLFMIVYCAMAHRKDIVHKYKSLLELFITRGANPYIKNIVNENVFDYLDREMAPTCNTFEDSEYNMEIDDYPLRAKDLAEFISECINQRAAKQMSALMIVGYFLIIPHDIRNYITWFNRNWYEI